jgi:serine/threonine-protein kinase SRPK3
MASFLRRVLPGRAWKPLDFSTNLPELIPLDERIEEELLPDYDPSKYYPASIGQILKDRYQIVGKLGFGPRSTTWLARDLGGRRHVALKISASAESLAGRTDNELSIYQRMSKVTTQHPGRQAVRELLDSFTIEGSKGTHRCLVHVPLWASSPHAAQRTSINKLPPAVLATTLRQLFLALDYLHTDCQIIHTSMLHLWLRDLQPSFLFCSSLVLNRCRYQGPQHHV